MNLEGLEAKILTELEAAMSSLTLRGIPTPFGHGETQEDEIPPNESRIRGIRFTG